MDSGSRQTAPQISTEPLKKTVDQIRRAYARLNQTGRKLLHVQTKVGRGFPAIDETHTGSRNWGKARLKVVKEQRKIADQRKDFHHKLSRVIADNCTAFICEDLAVKNMMKNRHLAKAIASVGWSQFLMMVKYKMERAGKYFRKVSRWYPSSQTCGCCGYKNADVKDLAVRKWVCPKCGTLHYCDINAQQNIFRMGMRLLQAVGIKII